MHNKVVYQAAKSLDALGLPVLRFNFRGAGLSGGKHDRGIPGLTHLLAGFSFGCWVGLRVGCEDERVSALIGMGTPVNSTDFSFLMRCEKPKLFVHGSNDVHGAIEKVKSLVASLPGENQLVAVEGADHFFTGKLDQLDHAVTNWGAAMLRPCKGIDR